MGNLPIRFLTILCAIVAPLGLAVTLGACGAGSVQSAAAPVRLPVTHGAVAPRVADPRAASSRAANPLTGIRFYVDPHSPAAMEVRRLRAQGSTHDAQVLERIADEPTGTWFANDSPQARTNVSTLVDAATAVNETPVIVVYDIPQRDCAGGYSAGGAPSSAAYLEWVSALAGGLGSSSAVVILEPDAIPDALIGCVSSSAVRARLALLEQAVATLERDPHAAVYIDAGNAAWIEQQRQLAGALRRAGIARAQGFALNVANFQSTSASVAYGERLSRLLHGAHFVIDTGRNGNGPDTNPADAPGWCNPPGRALGQTPTTDTGHRHVDAYLWVKTPGESDGSCRPGAPAAGTWWPQYALALASAAL